MATKKDDKPVQPLVRKGGRAEKDSAKAEQKPAQKPEAQEQAAAPAPQPPKPSAEELEDFQVPGRRMLDMNDVPTGSSRAGKPAPAPAAVTVEQGSLQDFEALLAEGGAAAAPRPMRVEVGEKYEGQITSIGDKWIYVDLGEGREGLARRDDFLNKQGELELAAGESRTFFVLGTNEGSILLGDQLSTRESAMDAIEIAHQSGVPLTGRVSGKNKGGFEVDLGGAKAFCPISQIELAFTEDPDVHLGQSYKFLVTEIREGGRSIVVSRAALMREEADRAREKTLETLEVGQVLEGTITRVADFGAFVDIGGLEGLVHVSELSFVRVEHPSELVRQGQNVKVTVVNIDTNDPKGLRVGLSMKDSMDDPWEGAQRELHIGSRVTGTVTRVEPFGAFVEVFPNVEGLVHVSELSWDHVKRPSDVVSVGQQLSVEVLDIDLARRRIGLSAKNAAGDPWTDASDRYKPGIEVSGTVENVEDFGVFVGLGSGITALIPRSEMDLAREATPHAKFSAGDEVTARVLSVEPERRRIALSMKSAEEIADSQETGPRSYSEGSHGLGTFADLLKDKLK